MFDLKTHLKSLVEAHGPSGHEAPIRAILTEAWQTLTDTTETDRLGSFIGIKRATLASDTPRRIMLAAHIDEIGMLVTDIIDGFLMIRRISGVDNRLMLTQTVLVHGRQLPGIVASVPPHLLTEDKRGQYPTWEELVVDVGLPAEEVASLVRIGDRVTVDTPMLELMNNKVAAKAMDDRACVAIMSSCLNELRLLQHRWNVYAAATVQEETGLYGAETAAYKIAPDIAIALDVGFARQPGVDADVSGDFNAGPLIGIGPNFHEKLNARLRDTAKKYEIKIQDDPLPGHSGTDAWPIQISVEGIPTALLSLPLRNMHSPNETADLRDIERTGRLLALFIASLDDDFMTALNWD
ncbi:MAG: M20/M25/M40 family metallo-hydrolase [Chloroflexi bacterium]|nr:M20/M25/M40 family metallo-hydrolase [Chloroflexota bacterium]